MFTAFARSSTLAALQRAVQVGCLEIEESGVVHRFGSPENSENCVRIVVLNDSFWKQIFLRGDLGFSEAYIMSDIELKSDNLEGFMSLWLENESRMTSLNSVFKRLSSAVSGVYIALFGQTLTQARLNCVAGYDQSNELFKAFLSKEMMYSSALFSEEEGGVHGDLLPQLRRHTADLEQAQLRKIHHVLRQARVQAGQRILEFGSGWGAVAIEKALAEERIHEAGLQDLVRVHLMDYRDIPPSFEEKFDAFISIEMLEVKPHYYYLKHVGPKYYATYFKIVDKALKSRDATVVITCSTFPEWRYPMYQYAMFRVFYDRKRTFLRDFVGLKTSHENTFGQTLTFQPQRLLSTLQMRGRKGRFILEGVENQGFHYGRTIREWGRRFATNATPEVLAKDFPSVTDPVIFEAFRRKWRYLFAYADAGLAHGYLTSHMFTFIRTDGTSIAKALFAGRCQEVVQK
ncbi:cyclopropane-fatty-acyl-phospholipid synthase [Lactarius akahatsu]|uniref:Cyclopropane-fatty-acyl-phospholipid synthase n=1 Tax=Lactarius akahatsu TaxID=416441 RepID=A0AAD4QB18_9AGAM|nr:cyclopropane-fatty-acyl-phospholipid synthase [Lactarius akahatsu]